MMAAASDLNNNTEIHHQQTNNTEKWEFDESNNVYVNHAMRRVMHSSNDQWVDGDYDALYRDDDEYMFDADEWDFDESNNVYVDHTMRRVMYNANDQWVNGDYDALYSDDNRYTFDISTRLWFDKVTEQYLFHNADTNMWVPINNPPQSPRILRCVVGSSAHFKRGQVVLVDQEGLTIGRDRSWDNRLRLPEMMVSKYHAMVFWDTTQQHFSILDNGSQHGTFVNGKRLSEAKQSSLPEPLRHLDVICIGSTSLEVHDHEALPCELCLTSSPINTRSGREEKKKQQQQKKENAKQSIVQQQQERTAWIAETKKMYRSDAPPDNSNYTDRAETRRQQDKHQPQKNKPVVVVAINQQQKQQQKTEKNLNTPQRTSLNTPVQGIGSQMLKKMGWKEGQSLGKHQNGILEPIRPSSQISRAGLGSSHKHAQQKKT